MTTQERFEREQQQRQQQQRAGSRVQTISQQIVQVDPSKGSICYHDNRNISEKRRME